MRVVGRGYIIRLVATLMKSDYSCEAYRSWKSAEYGLTWFGVIKLYLRVIHDQFFEFRVSSTSGYPFKLYKRYNSCRIRSLFSTERVTNIWNKLPVSITDFRTLSSFKKSLHVIDLTDLLADGWLLDCFVSRFNYVCLFCFYFVSAIRALSAGLLYLPVSHFFCQVYLLMAK